MEDKNKGISRRGFLTYAAVGAGTVALTGGMVRSTHAATPPQSWDKKADVVVVGAGGAGLMAAVRAKDAGADVIVLQKMPTVYTASTAVSGGLFSAAGTRAQKEKGIQDSSELFYQDFMKNGGFMNIPELARLLTANSVTVFEWLVDNGFPSFHFEPYPGHSVLRGHRSDKNSGRDLLETVLKQAQKRNIPIEFRMEVKKLYVDSTGRVVGVKAEKSGKTINVKANRAVVVASGGFVRDAETFDSWIPAFSGVGNLTGDPGNDGQGIKMMVKDAGAMPTHLQYSGTYPYGLEVSSRSGPVCRYWYFTPLGGILVNKLGKRYVNEMIAPTKLTHSLAAQPDKVHFLIVTKEIWDEVFAKYPPGGVISPGSPDWIEKELKAGNWLYRADTLAALAGKMGIDANELEKTVKTFNGYVQAGKDPDFGRDPKTLSGKLEGGPFYTVKLTFATVLTMGGIRINDKCQVLDPYGKTIPGLYAAGETTGGVHGSMYMGGCALAWAFTSGWFAGSNAAKEKS